MPPSQRDDDALVRAALAGDESAWDALIQRYQRYIFGTLRRLGAEGDDAEDLFQAVCLKLFLHLKDLRDTRRLGPWLAAVARQELWRRARRRADLPLDAATADTTPADDPDPADALADVERAHHVRQCVDELPENCRRLLNLLYAEESAYADVAAQLGIPVGSIGPTRARCLERLRRKLARFGYDG